MRLLIAALGLLLVAGCSSGPDPDDVPWSEYAPEWRERIEAAIDAEDCKALDAELVAAAEGDDAHEARYGSDNSDLMEYIDESMDEIDCYD